MPAALSEFPLTTTNGNYRRVADLTRYYEARVGCVQTVLGAGTAKLRIQYSIDQGTTWHYLHRKRTPPTRSSLRRTGASRRSRATEHVPDRPDVDAADQRREVHVV
jgi:hypothetical protein